MEPTWTDSWSDMAQSCDMDLWVMKWMSAWPIFHSPVILSYILKTIWCMYIILWEYESVWPDVWPKINVGYYDLYSMVQWFCLISWRLCDVWTILFGIMSQYDPNFYLKINIGHYDLYFMVQWFCLISWRLFDVCTLYFGSMNQYDQTFDLKINVGHCDLYSMVQWFCLISWRLFDVWTLLLGNESVWPKVLPQNKYILWSSDFALHLEDCLMYEHHTLWLRISMTWRLTSK